MPVFKKKKAVAEKAAPPSADLNDGPVKTIDKRVGFECYRDFFTVKNYWKTVRRNTADCGKTMFAQFLKSNPASRAKYTRLRNAPDEITAQCSDSGFEALSAEYLKVFDDVITVLEEQPEDATPAIKRLCSVGSVHKTKAASMQCQDFQQMEEPFLKMVSEILQDRFNDKAEALFRKFFQFCLQHLSNGMNS